VDHVSPSFLNIFAKNSRMEVQKAPISVYAEMTPNPAVMKFVANKMLIEQDSVEFKNIEEASASPLAQKLFHLPFVKEVFISGNYIAVSKFNIVEWEDVTQEVRTFLLDELQNGTAVLNGEVKQETTSDANENTIALPNLENLDDVEKRIVEILDEYVAPAVGQDGGFIRFMGYENKVVKVLLQGACSGCPSSTMTLKNGILQILQSMLPTLVEDVEAVNG
jgi:Fe-S cluster biogenesis protein NfuA